MKKNNEIHFHGIFKPSSDVYFREQFRSKNKRIYNLNICSKKSSNQDTSYNLKQIQISFIFLVLISATEMTLILFSNIFFC